MNISMEAVLEAAGIRHWEDPVESAVEMLRDGFPSYVIRVRPSAIPAGQSVIVKACPVSSREPDVLLTLYRKGYPVPAVLDVREGDGFRVIAMEDVGGDALHKHPDAEWYRAAVREIAGIHGASSLFDVWGGPSAALTDLVPTYVDAKWAAIVREGLEGTLRRLDDGTYKGIRKRRKEKLPDTLKALAEKTLAMVQDPNAHRPFPHVLVHGDYHVGNILIRTPKSGGVAAPPPPKPRDEHEIIRQAVDRFFGRGAVTLPDPFAIVDWDSARWDSGFFDLVSLFDVSERMGAFRLDPEEIIRTYLDAYTDIHADTHANAYRHSRLPEIHLYGLCVRSAQAEWRRCRVLRAWEELRWFSETGEDFGGRIDREIEIIRRHVD